MISAVEFPDISGKFPVQFRIILFDVFYFCIVSSIILLNWADQFAILRVYTVHQRILCRCFCFLFTQRDGLVRRPIKDLVPEDTRESQEEGSCNCPSCPAHADNAGSFLGLPDGRFDFVPNFSGWFKMIKGFPVIPDKPFRLYSYCFRCCCS